MVFDINKEKLSKFAEKTAQFINALTDMQIFKLEPELQELEPELQKSNHPKKEFNPGPPIDPTLYVFKKRFLFKMHFDCFVGENPQKIYDSNGVEEKDYYSLVQKYVSILDNTKKDIINSNTEADFLKSIHKHAEFSIPVLKEITALDGKFVGMDFRSPVHKFIHNHLLNLGFNHPEKFLEDYLILSKDDINSGFFKDLKIENHPDDLLRFANTINLRDKEFFPQMQKRITELSDKFGINFFSFPHDYQHTPLEKLDRFEQQATDFSKRMGIAENCVGLRGNLGFCLENHINNCEGYSQPLNSVIGLKLNDKSTLAHEWVHALDSHMALSVHKRIVVKYDVKDLQVFGNDNFHVSSSNISVPLDGSREMLSFNKMKEFAANAFTNNVEDFKKIRDEKRVELAERFMVEAIGSSYFQLPKDVQKKLLSDEGVELVRAKVILSSSDKVSQDINMFIKNTCGDKLTSYEQVDSFTNSSSKDNEFLRNQREQYDFSEDVTVVEESRLIKTSKNADQDLIDKKGNIYQLMKSFKEAPFGNFMRDDYYHSKIEVLARYTQGQLYPAIAVDSNLGTSFQNEIFSNKKDPRFDNFRKEVISSYLGKESVKDMELPSEKTQILLKKSRLLFSRLIIMVGDTCELLDMKIKSARNNVEEKEKNSLEGIKVSPEDTSSKDKKISTENKEIPQVKSSEKEKSIDVDSTVNLKIDKSLIEHNKPAIQDKSTGVNLKCKA